MSARVLFINTGYLPTHQEWVRLENIQLELSGWRAELYREWELKRFTPGERYLSKQRFHHGVRDNWKVYQGFNIKNTNVLYLPNNLA